MQAREHAKAFRLMKTVMEAGRNDRMKQDPVEMDEDLVILTKGKSFYKNYMMMMILVAHNITLHLIIRMYTECRI